MWLRPEAEANLAEASQWYEQRRDGLGVEFLEEVDRALEKIAGNPRRYPMVYQDVRRARMKRFPYGIFYVFDEKAISVLRVLHQARDPALWQRR